MPVSKIERRNRLNQLMDIYGELLTDRQREFMELHYAEDLSFGEIAEQFEVSRQAIHDAVKHGEESLENYELKLKLMVRFPQLFGEEKGEEGSASEVVGSEPSGSTKGSHGTLDKLAAIKAELSASGGVIYNANEVAAQLGDILTELKQALLKG